MKGEGEREEEDVNMERKWKKGKYGLNTTGKQTFCGTKTLTGDLRRREEKDEKQKNKQQKRRENKRKKERDRGAEHPRGWGLGGPERDFNNNYY